ncbi:hypothetical protein V8E36_004979 [Tilletia maclaganii]
MSGPDPTASNFLSAPSGVLALSSGGASGLRSPPPALGRHDSGADANGPRGPPSPLFSPNLSQEADRYDAPNPGPHTSSLAAHASSGPAGPSASMLSASAPPPPPAPAPAAGSAHGPAINHDLEGDHGPSLIHAATDAIRLLQDASERAHVLLAFRKASAEAEARAKALEEESREAAKRAMEARSAANHLVTIIQQIERGPNVASSSSHSLLVSGDASLSFSAQAPHAAAAFASQPDLSLGDTGDMTESFFSLGGPVPSAASIPVGGTSNYAAQSRGGANTTNRPRASGAESAGAGSSDARKRPRPSSSSIDNRRCDDCQTSDTVLWRHIENEVFCNACALRRRRATKRAHLEAKRVAGAVSASASASGAGFGVGDI